MIIFSLKVILSSDNITALMEKSDHKSLNQFPVNFFQIFYIQYNLKNDPDSF